MRSFFALALAAAASGEIISGQGKWRYQYRPELLQLPDSEVNNDENGHGVALDKKGNIYFTFVPKHVTNETQVLVRFSPDGTQAKMLGMPGPKGLSAGTPHGLRIEHDPVANESFFYHANNAHKVMKTTLEGDIIWTADFQNWETEHPEYWPYTPTDAVVVPGTDELLVADGYGSSFVHVLNKTTGEYLHRTFGGKGNATQPVKFDTPHGINLDKSSGHFVVSDRSNNRLVWVNSTGSVIDSKASEIAPLPCSADVFQDDDEGFVTAVASLGLNYTDIWNGSVVIYDKDTKPLSKIEVADKIGNLGHQHPHDAMFLPNGDLVVCCWGGPATPGLGPAKGTISYWQRLPEEASSVSV